MRRAVELERSGATITADMRYGPRSHRRRSSDVILEYERNPVLAVLVLAAIVLTAIGTISILIGLVGILLPILLMALQGLERDGRPSDESGHCSERRSAVRYDRRLYDNAAVANGSIADPRYEINPRPLFGAVVTVSGLCRPTAQTSAMSSIWSCRSRSFCVACARCHRTRRW